MSETLPVLLSDSLACLRPVVVDDLVRIGNAHDGGYVISQRVIPAADSLLSFGINDDWTFEEDFHCRNSRCAIHAYDHTVGERDFYRRARKAVGRVLGLKRGARAELQQARKIHRDYQNFFTANRVHFRERIFNREVEKYDATIEKVFSRIAGKSNVVVKMDIEGGEYRVIPSLLRRQESISLMVVEFHDTEPLRQTFLSCINQALAHYQVIHVHGNNAGGAGEDGVPEILEVTFLSRRFPVQKTWREVLPLSGLDAPNFPDRPDFRLRFDQPPVCG